MSFFPRERGSTARQRRPDVQAEGYVEVEIALALDNHYKEIFPLVEHVVTFHDWSRLSGYDAACRKIVQLITHHVRPKRRELLLHLGPANGLGQIAVRAAAETISKLKRTPIEIFSSDSAFDGRAEEVLQRYFGLEKNRENETVAAL